MGKIVITRKDSSGRHKKAIQIPFNEAGFPVLPAQTYLFETSVKEKLEAGKYGLELALEFGKGKLNQMLEFSIDREGKVTLK